MAAEHLSAFREAIARLDSSSPLPGTGSEGQSLTADVSLPGPCSEANRKTVASQQVRNHDGPMTYAMTGDSSAATWLGEQLAAFNGAVADVIPPVFEAYARIPHPAYRDENEVSWGDVAAANARTAHPLMQWEHITARRRANEQPGVWDEEPYEGNLPEAVARLLAGVLVGHTRTPGECWFGVWQGWAGMGATLGGTAAFEIADRAMFLLSGPLESVYRTSLDRPPGDYAHGPSVAVAVNTATATDEGGEINSATARNERDPFWRSPNLWWPEDRAWCVATEIDFNSTYVGGNRHTIDALLHTPSLETYAVSPTDPVTGASDTVNPPPRTGR